MPHSSWTSSHFARCRAAGAVVAAALIAGCAPLPSLEVDPAQRVPGASGETGTATVAAVRLEAEAEAWDGTSIDDDVTPVRVRIENDGRRPLRLRYADLSLVAPNGRVYRALSPLTIEGTTLESWNASTVGVYPRRLGLGPSVSSYYLPFGSPYFGFYRDPFLFGLYPDYRQRIPLPTERMLISALAEGVIEPGGAVEGFVYFEPLEAVAGAIELRLRLIDPRSNEAFGDAVVPFRVTLK